MQDQNDTKPPSRAERVREVIFATALRQANTTAAGRALATGIMADGEPVGGGNHREALLRSLCEQIAANVATYADIPELCEVCGGISQGNTCCAPPLKASTCCAPPLKASTQRELMGIDDALDDARAEEGAALDLCYDPDEDRTP